MFKILNLSSYKNFLSPNNLLRIKTLMYENQSVLELLYLKDLSFMKKLLFLNSMKTKNIRFSYYFVFLKKFPFTTIVYFILSNLLIMVLFYLIYRQYSMLGTKKIKFSPIKKTGVYFKDIIGIDEFKNELEEILLFLKKRESLLEAGIVIPKGVLLIGPPGCGKTQLARAVAGEANLPFYYTTASDFLQPYVGEGTEVISELFKSARKHKRGAIIFIDELDSIESRNEFASSMNQTVNQLLTEMNGFQAKDNIIVLAATNREDALDKALVRSGRFDLKIHIKLPTFGNRLKIFDYYSKNVKCDKSVNIDELAKLTVNFSPVEIKNMVNLAALHSVKLKKYIVDHSDFISAFERIKLGIKSKYVTAENIEDAAIRESAKAILSLNEPLLPKVEKINLGSFGESVQGKSIFLEKIDATNYTKEEILKRIDLSLAGRAAEDLWLKGKFTSFTKQDSDRANNLARRYFTELAMEEDFSLISLETKYFSEQTKKEIDDKIENLIRSRYQALKHKLKTLEPDILKLSDKLREKEEMHVDEIKILLKNSN